MTLQPMVRHHSTRILGDHAEEHVVAWVQRHASHKKNVLTRSKTWFSDKIHKAPKVSRGEAPGRYVVPYVDDGGGSDRACSANVPPLIGSPSPNIEELVHENEVPNY